MRNLKVIKEAIDIDGVRRELVEQAVNVRESLVKTEGDYTFSVQVKVDHERLGAMKDGEAS